VEILAPYVVSLHLKDFVVRKTTQGYRISGAPLGQGWLDAAAVLAVLTRTQRPFNVLLEQWVDREATLEATRRTEDDWVRQNVAYARDRLGLGPSDVRIV
jgi:L-ribulose-5-phosphate 3-epimerase UlaE